MIRAVPLRYADYVVWGILTILHPITRVGETIAVSYKITNDADDRSAIGELFSKTPSCPSSYVIILGLLYCYYL